MKFKGDEDNFLDYRRKVLFMEAPMWTGKYIADDLKTVNRAASADQTDEALAGFEGIREEPLFFKYLHTGGK